MRAARLTTLVALLALAFHLLASPAVALSVFPRGWSGVGAASVVIAVSMLLFALFWPAANERENRGRWPFVAFSVVLAVTLAGAAVVFGGWVDRLLLVAIDPAKGDMLVEISAALDRFSTGHDPYFIYHVPWDLPLTYGPGLWMWFLIPRALGADPRMMTAFGQLFVPVLTGLAAALSRSSRRVRPSRDSTGARLGDAEQPVARRLRRDRPHASVLAADGGVCCRMFCRCAQISRDTARTAPGRALSNGGARSRVRDSSLVREPRRDRAGECAVRGRGDRVLRAIRLWDWRMFVYGLYGYYVTTIKGYVWTQTTWMSSTLGLTRTLLASGHANWIGVSQVFALASVYLLAWRSLRVGGRPGPWCCLALLAFSMTTLWPVWYIFLDVFVLGAAFLASDETPTLRRLPWRMLSAATVAVVVIMTATLVWNPGVFYTLEPGRTPRWHFRSGFGPDETDASRAFVWTTRATVHMRLPRGLRTDARIQIECDPVDSTGAASQTMRASLNGDVLGEVRLEPGWQVASFDAPIRDWLIGHNDLTLSFAYIQAAAAGEDHGARIASVKIARPEWRR